MAEQNWCHSNLPVRPGEDVRNGKIFPPPSLILCVVSNRVTSGTEAPPHTHIITPTINPRKKNPPYHSAFVFHFNSSVLSLVFLEIARKVLVKLIRKNSRV